MSTNQLELIATLLDRVANGQLAAQQALADWPDTPSGEPIVDASWHDLSHFAADEDVRAKDGRYREYQEQLLRKRAEELRETAKRK